MNEERLKQLVDLRVKQEQTKRVLEWAKLQLQMREFRALRGKKIQKTSWLFWEFCYSIYKMNDMRNLPPLPEVTWLVTFDNDSTVFIAARDKGHARRIVENNKGFSRWRRTEEEPWQIRTIKNIELA